MAAKRDLTVLAVPGYFATMGLEYAYLKRRRAEAAEWERSRGILRSERSGWSEPVLRAEAAEWERSRGYERNDTIASLAMGVGSLIAPLVVPKVLAPITPGKGKYAKAFVFGVAVAAAATTIADVVAKRAERATLDDSIPAPTRSKRRRSAAIARRVARAGGAATVAGGVTAVATAWTAATKGERLWPKRVVPDLGEGPLAWLLAIAGWDFIYYWNHRFMHETRFMWAIHVVHHSSERYNLSTALRQPVADSFGTYVPYGALALFGIRPSLIAQARAINLIYQYWIHTETIRTLGAAESVLNTASHHRVHHGSNRQYIDRNHGSILITWDKLFGTFEPEGEPVVYGLTKNLDTFRLDTIATHEYRDILRDVADSDSWSDRLSFAFRGPGWAYERHAASTLT